ncbi:MAG: RNA 2',3'-cyclic phosphodiesterase [Actinomycetota bacterium]
MAKERLKSPRARLFVALDLPEPVREGIVAWQRAELTDQALRVVPPQNLHVTLVFLGFTPEKAIPRVAEIVNAVEAGAPAIELQREPRAKPRGRPGLFALEAASEASVALQADLEAKLVAERFYKPEKRPFWPHLTVARVRKERRGSKRPARVGRRPGPLPEALCEPFGAVRITLYRSKIRPQGAEYTSLAQVELSEAGQRLGD